MKRSFFIAVISLFTTCLLAQTPTRTVKFSPVISGVTNCDSITTAIRDLKTSGGTIWVAAGTYKEPELTIPSGVTVIGGFPANATTSAQRIYPGVATTAQLSILNGNYQHRVATVSGTLVGCVITKGYAYANGTNGGGVLITGGNVLNCILTYNIASSKAPSPTTIPGTYVASIGDIYCTDSTLVEPTYSVNSNGKYVATLPSGYSYNSGSGLITTPKGTKTPLGIVFYVNSAATTKNILIVGKPSTGRLQWTNTCCTSLTDIPGLTDITTQGTAQADMNGATNTLAVYNYITSNSINIIYYPAINYVKSYPKSGTSVIWYIPAGGEMFKMWSVYPQIDACATLLTWETSTWFPSNPYWTSTEYNAQNEWILNAFSYPSSPATLVAPSGDANKTASSWVFPVASINY